MQFFRERAGHGASGERVPDAAAAQHHQTQGGAVSGVRRLAGAAERIFREIRQQHFSLPTGAFRAVAGGHEVGDQPTGAAEGGGEEEGTPAGEGEGRATSEEQVSEGEGRAGERLLLLFQRQVTKTSSSSLNGHCQPRACAGLRPANHVYSLRFDIFMCICEFTCAKFSVRHIFTTPFYFFL